MKKSIVQPEEKCCMMCGTTRNLELHHIFFGTANRKISDKHGFTVWLCNEHHRGRISPHRDRDIDRTLKRLCQVVYEREHTREEFIELIGRNYL